MKRRILLSLGVIALAVWALAQAVAPPASLARYLPSGPLLVLEAQDFGALVRDWNGSAEKQAWLKSDNFEVFSRSRLYLRLTDAANEFTAAAGLPPSMALVDAVAGGESALGLYDIGSLQFLYITRMEQARALETALWRLRSSYETRNAGGFPYFVRTDPASRRVVAFASANGYLLLATREDLMAGALSLLAGKPGATAREERWYAESVRAARAPGDLRLMMNLSSLVRSPYFRSYWIQRNVAAIRQYGAGIADLYRSPGEYREDRVLLRFDQPNAADRTTPALARVVPLAPDGAGLYRASAKPSAAQIVGALEEILAPGPRNPAPSQIAPYGPVATTAGTEADLEIRIDEPPLAPARPEAIPPALRTLIENAPVEAMLEVGSTRAIAGDVFVGIDSAVVILASAAWDATVVRSALASAPASGPLGRVAFEVQGPVLIISNSPALAKQIAARVANPAQATAATYAAAFQHAGERARFLNMMRLMDNAPGRRGDGQQPALFSDNIGSLSTALARVTSETIVRRDTGTAVYETLTYRLAK